MQKKIVLFINLLGIGLTQETNGDEDPSDGLLLIIISRAAHLEYKLVTILIT